MRDKLAGRLTWEQMPEGIRVEIPARPGAWAYLFSPLIVLWLVLAAIRYWHLMGQPHAEDTEFKLQMISMGIYALGFCIFVFWLAFTFTADTVLILDKTEMKLQRRVLGVELSSRSFPTNQVYQVHYIAPQRPEKRRSVVDPNTSKIRFEVDEGTHSFARGITETEACALILLMLTVYKFPHSYAPMIIEV
jgi:hypothetical protein